MDGATKSVRKGEIDGGCSADITHKREKFETKGVCFGRARGPSEEADGSPTTTTKT